MAMPHPSIGSSSRNGITLLEVLIAMFVLAVGILGVFGLFAAGREMEARAILLQRAKAYADGPGLAQVNGWMSVGQWMQYDDAGWKWVHSTATPNASNFEVELPLMIDPVSLAIGADGSPTVSGTMTWNWNRVVELPGAPSIALKRITLPGVRRALTPPNTGSNIILPLRTTEVLDIAGDPDDVRFSLDPVNADDPPRNGFALGRRSRNSDLVAALFLANSADPPSGEILPIPVRRWILIHHKPFVGYERSLPDNEEFSSEWPAGSQPFNVSVSNPEVLTPAVLTAHSILELQCLPGRYPEDDTVLRRTLQSGRWLLFIHEKPANSGRYQAEWIRIASVTRRQQPNQPDSWMVLLDSQQLLVGWNAERMRCIGFESLVYVKELLPAVELTIP